ncbi:uncharacterized protein LOC134529457 [Bacillus rossius redtenbacheri]|uniref:uncharacterized protein LOC134529457 n=1 Tax=Bacillus rossius redtenbacheri TaxID=93214 RepID=UPI002FDDC33E
MLTFNLTQAVGLTTGAVMCQDTMECANMDMPGYTCKNSRCVCDPERDTGLFSCRADAYGEKCRKDYDCMVKDENLFCMMQTSVCRCRRGLLWDIVSKKCYMLEDVHYGGKFDPVRDVIIPGIIIMTIGAMVYLGIKLFCNCGKLWRRRRRRADLSREADDPMHQQPATWVASYRVFSSLNGVETRSSPVLSPSSSFPLHPTPCMGLFLPSSSLAASAASPPPYEEALKHKVILSSYPSGAAGTTVLLPSAAIGVQQVAPPPATTPAGTSVQDV